MHGDPSGPTSTPADALPHLVALVLPEALRRIFRDEMEPMLRSVVRQELAQVVPELRRGAAYLSIREAAKRYRLGYEAVRSMVDAGTLAVTRRPNGRGGRTQWMILAADADAKLGGASTASDRVRSP